MRLILVQHGEAVSGELDPDRPLTDQGRRQGKAIGAFLRARGVQVARILHSGKTRARMTAALLADEGLGGPLAEQTGLAPNDPPEVVAGAAARWHDDVLAVGHLPHLDRLVATLVCGRAEGGLVAFSPGTAVCLVREGDAWRLAWVLPAALVEP